MLNVQSVVTNTYSKLLSVIKTLEANETQRENEYFLNKFMIQYCYMVCYLCICSLAKLEMKYNNAKSNKQIHKKMIF